MKVGELVLYNPKWGSGPGHPSPPAGIATLIQHDDEEWKVAKRKPRCPKWQILFDGKLKWAYPWQVRRLDESR